MTTLQDDLQKLQMFLPADHPAGLRIIRSSTSYGGFRITPDKLDEMAFAAAGSAALVIGGGFIPAVWLARREGHVAIMDNSYASLFVTTAAARHLTPDRMVTAAMPKDYSCSLLRQQYDYFSAAGKEEIAKACGAIKPVAQLGCPTLINAHAAGPWEDVHEQFTVIYAARLFNTMMPAEIKQCADQVSAHLTDGGKFFTSFWTLPAWRLRLQEFYKKIFQRGKDKINFAPPDPRDRKISSVPTINMWRLPPPSCYPQYCALLDPSLIKQILTSAGLTVISSDTYPETVFPRGYPLHGAVVTWQLWQKQGR